MATIELTDDALRNIENMMRRVWDIENKMGLESEEADKARHSYLHVLRTIFQWPGKVIAEDDLSLLICSSITIGAIWHPARLTDGSKDPLLGSWSTHS